MNQSHIHTPDDGRGKRAVLLNGRKVQSVFLPIRAKARWFSTTIRRRFTQVAEAGYPPHKVWQRGSGGAVSETAYFTGLRELQQRVQAISDAVGEKTALKPVGTSLRKCAVTLQASVKAHLQARGHVLSGYAAEQHHCREGESATAGHGDVHRHGAPERETVQGHGGQSARRQSWRQVSRLRSAVLRAIFRIRHIARTATPWMRPAFEETKGHCQNSSATRSRQAWMHSDDS
jgi:hypothetical protein